LPQTALCYRNLDPVSEMKAYPKRTDGPLTKFKRDDPSYSLLAYAQDVLNHMRKHGMDTVFHVKGVSAGSTEKGEELLTYHSRYTKAQVDDHIEAMKKVWDPYAMQALEDSFEWIYNSIDESLKNDLRFDVIDKATGPQLWMLIVQEVQKASSRLTAELTKKWQSLQLASFKGENVKDYVNAALDLLVQLDRNGKLPETHLTDIVDHLTACSVMDFKILWMTERRDVEQFLEKISGKEKKVIEKMPDKITYQSLLAKARRNYMELEKKWNANAVSPREQAMISEMKAMSAQIKRLESQKPAASGSAAKTAPAANGEQKKKGTCWNCGAEDHIRPNCPHPKKAKGQGGSGGSSGGDSDGSLPKHHTPPKAGESHERTVNGKKKFWCASCRDGKGLWNNTHKTADHKSKEQLKAENPPAARVASTDVCQELHSSWFD